MTLAPILASSLTACAVPPFRQFDGRGRGDHRMVLVDGHHFFVSFEVVRPPFCRCPCVPPFDVRFADNAVVDCLGVCHLLRGY